MSNVRKNKDIIKKENCICPKSENGEDIIINFYVYVQIMELYATKFDSSTQKFVIQYNELRPSTYIKHFAADNREVLLFGG